MKRGEEIKLFKKSKVAFLSNYPPRECGIATFTQDLITVLNKKFNPKMKSRVIALNDEEDFYNYNNKVIMQLNKDDVADYISIAKRVNHSKSIRIVCIQHEFGLFGGPYGSYIIPFLETVEKPVVVTFHSVLPNPDEMRRKVVRFIAAKSAALIVMANIAVDILNKDYGIDRNKVHVVPHGIPDAPYAPSEEFKKRLKLENKIVLSTFGLLSKGKGIEYMIKALPKLIKKYPNILYLVIGETHPVVREREGEKYRKKLIAIVERLGLTKNVKFYNKYVALPEIIQYLLASDIYICTNLEKNQIVSGTLSYALGCGKAIVSTPSIYAEEVLNGRGVLAKNFKDPQSYAQAVDKILSDPKFRSEIEKNAYYFGRTMAWSNVASNYLNIFNKLVRLREETTEKFPSIKLNHLETLTDNFGCIQFSELAIPDKKSGYTTDDNARALIAATLYHEIFKSKQSLDLIRIYIHFLKIAQRKDGHFKNNFKNKNSKLDKNEEDAYGRSIWALGYFMNKSEDESIIKIAKKIFAKAYKFMDKLESPRSKAFSIKGLYYYNLKFPSQKNISKIKKLADNLVDCYHNESSKDWQWFEPSLTYANSKLPESLFIAYNATKNKKYLKIAEKSLNFLTNLVFIDNQLSPIGQRGWCKRNGIRAFFDQQPVDAACMVQSYLTAYSITGKEDYYKKAILAFNWFLGKNHLKQMIYDPVTGGCYDGLGENSLNLNRGAESTISYLIARLMLEEAKRKKANE
jgi:glycosyltransferase involved in cell wall biosynthesis